MTLDDAHILLTGGTGFFGKALLRYFATQQQVACRVSVISRNPDRFIKNFPELASSPNIRWIQADIQIEQSLPFEGSFTHIIHAAADSTHGPELSPLERFSQILDGTRNILTLAQRTGVKRFLFTSSGAVYGQGLNIEHGMHESLLTMPDPLSQDHAYGVSKRAAEHLCVLYGHYFDIVIARCFSFIGQDLPIDVHFAAGNFLRDALFRSEIVVQGDGRAIRSYLDQRDLAEWLMTLLVRGPKGQAVNVGSNQPISIAHLAQRIRDLVAPKTPVIITQSSAPALPSLRSIYWPDTSRAQSLGLRQKIELNASIIDFADFYRKHKYPTP